MPLDNFLVRLRWKGVLGQVFREGLRGLGMLQVPFPYAMLYEGHMFLGTQQNLDCLPTNEALQCKGGDGRLLELLVHRLHQGVRAPRLRPYFRQRRVRRVKKDCCGASKRISEVDVRIAGCLVAG
jgi:hypothetical protein